MLLCTCVVFLGLLAKNNAFPVQNSRSRFVKKASTPPTQCRIYSKAPETLLFSSREEQEGSKESSSDLFLLDYSIDSFLRGDYDRTFSEDAASPLPGLSPSDTVEAALRSLRYLDEPEPSHGAAVFLRFCVELSRGEKWGITTSSAEAWTEILRGALTPTMLARRMRASEDFSSLLDWTQLEVSEDRGDRTTPMFRNENVAHVDATLFFDDETASSPPETFRFELAKMLGGVWLIQSAQCQTPPPRVARKPTTDSLPPQPARRKRANGSNQQRRKPMRQQPQQGKRNIGRKKGDDRNNGKRR